MITLNYAQIRSSAFNPLLTSLLQTRLDYKHAKQIVDIVHAVRLEQQKSDELWTVLSNQYLDPVDEKNPQMGMQLKKNFTLEEAHDANQQIAEFLRTEFKVDVQPLSEKALQKLKLTGQELLLLAGMIA